MINERVCAAIIKNGSILMVRHRHDGRDYWTLPGGGVEPGESPQEAVIREVREETGMTIKVSRLLFETRRRAEDSHSDWQIEKIEQCFLAEGIHDQEPRLG